MKKIKNKKGQIFSLIAIVILFVIFSSFGIYSMIHEKEKARDRIESMDSFLFSVEKNMERQLYVSGFRIIFLVQDEITRTGDYIEDFDSIFQESIHNGTFKGEMRETLLGTTLEDIEKNIQNEAEKFNIEINISKKEPFIEQNDPWFVTVGLNFTLEVEDKSELASWKRNESIKAQVEIERFDDPLYFVSTNGIISRRIDKTPYENHYVEEDDVSNLSEHVDNKLYAHNPNAPSFLNRLEGNISPSENGIESFVHTPELSKQDLAVKDKSLIDHIYFSEEDLTHFQIEGMPDWFKIDDENDRLSKYQVENLVK